MLPEYEGVALNSDLYHHDELYEQFNSNPSKEDLAPITLLCCDTIQGHLIDRPLVVLLDGDSSGSLINKRSIPKGAVASRSAKKHTTTTASGNFDSSLSVGVQDIRLPEFSNVRRIEGWNLRVFNSTACQYDMILGRDFMQHIGIDNFFSTDTIQWIDRSKKKLHITMI